MALPEDLQKPLESGEHGAFEDAWLQRLGGETLDVATFATAARELARLGEDERARFLLGMLDAELGERQAWRQRLELLRRAGSLLLDPEAIHPEILATLGRLHGERASFAGLAEHLGLHRAVHDLPKTWEKVARLEQLLIYDLGTVVAMEGRGVGRVVEANFQLDSFKVAFAAGGPMQVGFRAAPKVLEVLPPGHILRRRLEEPETLARLAAEDPAELLRVVLVSRGRPLQAGEIRQNLAGVVSDGAWTSFWAAARKHPQVVVGGKGRQTYSWAESSDHALEAVWKAFAAADPRKRIDLLRREGERDPDLAGRMAGELVRQGLAAAAADPGLAFEIWAALERSGRAPEGTPFAAEALVDAPRRRVDALLAGIGDRSLRERALDLVRRRREDWRQVFVDRLGREDEPRVLDLLADTLEADPGELGRRELERLLDGIVSQPQRQPALFVWLAERAGDDPVLRRRHPLRLLQQILAAPHRDELAPFRPRLKALAESGSTLPRLLAELAEDQAVPARDAVHRAALLEPYQRDALGRALEVRFPALAVEDKDSETLYALPASIEAKRRELDQITRHELPANRKAIEEARAHGDLRENFEYKAARQRHELLSAMATRLHRDLGRARPVDLAAVDPTQVRVGARVTLATDAGERTLTVLGPWESDPEGGVISYESELGASLLGKAVGDELVVEGRPARVTAVAVATAPPVPAAPGPPTA